MKRFVLASVCAVGLLGLSQQQASAWINAKFSIGFSWNLQCGDNCFLWGPWNCGPMPSGGAYPFAGPPLIGFVPAPIVPSYWAPPVVAPYAAQVAPAPQAPYAGSYGYASPFQNATYTRPEAYYYAPPYYGYGR